MTTLQELMDLERGFWLEGADYYRQHLADDFVMLFPGVGPMQREQAIEGIEGGRRWTHLETSNELTLDVAPDVCILCYEAAARRQDESNYSALVASVYVRRSDSWELAFHQQSPLE